ncbi:MAG: hypothetical protein H6983_12460 [Ectothiorhodospiraceae bacterium]|nr:hypothetical protein [Ectothiorhodospiraceae bacterium]
MNDRDDPPTQPLFPWKAGRLGGDVAPVLGVELGQEALHLVQLAGGDGMPRIRVAASVPWGSERDVALGSARRLRALLDMARDQVDLRGDAAVVCLPADHARLMVATVRVSDGMSEEEAFRAQVLDRLEGGPDAWLVDRIPLTVPDPACVERRMMLALVARDEAEAYRACLADAGLDVRATELGPVALRRLVSVLAGRPPYPSMVLVNIGRTRTFLTLVAGRRLVLDRPIAGGEDDVLRALAVAMRMAVPAVRVILYRFGLVPRADLPQPSAAAGDLGAQLRLRARPALTGLVEDIRQLMTYAAAHPRAGPVQRVLLLGSAARWPGGDSLLGELLGVPVEQLDPLSLLDALPGAAGHVDPTCPAALAVATGCALHHHSTL